MFKSKLSRSVALEAIQHQYDTRLFKSLAIEFGSVAQLDNPTAEDVASLPIPKLVFEHTGMWVSFAVDPYHGFNAYMSPPQLNKNHVLIRDWARSFGTNDDAIRELRKLKSNKLTGSVDRKKGRVSGVFSKVEAITGVYLGLFHSYNGTKLTGEEIAAVYLHELGHLFNWYELLANQLTVNYALKAVKETFLNTNDKLLRISILNEIDLAIGGNIAGKETAAEKIYDEETLAVILSKSNVEYCRSELGSSLYDRRGFEFLADQYAVRMGAGVHIATGLSKMQLLRKHKSYDSYYDHLMTQLTGTLLFVSGSVLTLGLLPLLLLLGDDPILYSETESYDRPGERFSRIRRELVDALKQKDMPKQQKELYIEDVETLLKLEKMVTDRWSWWVKAYGFIFPSARKARNKILQQQLLEELANNQLYTSAAKLSTLA